MAVHQSSDPGHWIVTFPWTGAERAQTIAEAAVALAGRDVPASTAAELTHRAASDARPLERRVWRGADDAARLDPRCRAERADRVRLGDQRQEHRDPADHPHPDARRPPRRHDDVRWRAGRRTDGRARRLDRTRWRAADPGPGTTSRSRSSRRRAVGSSCAASATNSNDVSILTNVSSDHLDLQGIHTLPELAEVKSTICRITKPEGWVILNADDAHVAAVARRVRGQVAYFTLGGRGSRIVARHRASGRPRVPREPRHAWSKPMASDETEIVEVARVPLTIGGLAPHNVANALAAAGGARGVGATIAQVRDGLIEFAPTADRSPGRLNLFRLGSRVIIVDFAHNEAGIAADPRRRRGHRRRGGCAGRPDHRDHRDRRRSAGRHAPRDRPDRGKPRPASGHQGDAQVPARPDRAVGRRRVAGRGRGRRRARRQRDRSTAPRRRRSRPSSTGRPRLLPPGPGRTHRGSSC